MTMTTILCEKGKLYDLDLHEKRLKEGCEVLGLPWPELELPQTHGRARLKIVIADDGPSYYVDPCPPYSDEALSLTVKEDAGIRRKTPHTAQRKEWGNVLTVDEKKTVLQAACANLFWYSEGEFMTPCYKTLPLIQGTCLQRLQEVIPFTLVSWSIEELVCKKPLLFLCNAIREIVPIKQVDKAVFPENRTFFESLLGQYRKIRYAGP